MRKLAVAILLACSLLSLVQASPASAANRVKGLSTVCKKVTPFPARVLYKFSASGHLASSDRARSCSLIVGKGNNTYPRLRYLPLYDESGTNIATFVNFAMGGHIYAARWYTHGPSCSQVASTAIRRTKKAIGYVAVGRGVCWKVTNLRGRVGSVF